MKELIAALNKLNPDVDVLCYSEDTALLSNGHMFRLLDIDHVDEAEGEKTRDENGAATLKLGKSAHSTKMAFINLTSDF